MAEPRLTNHLTRSTFKHQKRELRRRAGGNLGFFHFSSLAREAGWRLVQRPERVGCAKGPALTPSAPTSPHTKSNLDPSAIVAGRSHPIRIDARKPRGLVSEAL